MFIIEFDFKDSPSPAKNRPCLPTSPTHIQAMRHATQQKHGAQLHALNSTGSSVQSPLSSSSSHNSNSPHSQSQLQHLQSNQMQSQIPQQSQQQDFLTQQIQQMVSCIILLQESERIPQSVNVIYNLFSSLRIRIRLRIRIKSINSTNNRIKM